jgi:hypothetical protein
MPVVGERACSHQRRRRTAIATSVSSSCLQHSRRLISGLRLACFLYSAPRLARAHSEDLSLNSRPTDQKCTLGRLRNSRATRARSTNTETVEWSEAPHSWSPAHAMPRGERHLKGALTSRNLRRDQAHYFVTGQRVPGAKQGRHIHTHTTATANPTQGDARDRRACMWPPRNVPCSNRQLR